MIFMTKSMILKRSLIIMNDKNEIIVDKKKAASLIKRIIIAESRNLKSEEKSDNQMVTAIKKMIEEEVKCL